jgi:hypothetical protein
MPKPTQQTLLIRALKARGYRSLVSPSRKYEAFEDGPGGRVYFVGKSGALRVNKRLAVTDSISLERSILRVTLLAEGANVRSQEA